MRMSGKIVVFAVSIVVVWIMLMFVTSCRKRENICVVPECRPWPKLTAHELCAAVTSTLCKKSLEECTTEEERDDEVVLDCIEQMYTMCVVNDAYSPTDADRIYEICIPTINSEHCDVLGSETSDDRIYNACRSSDR